jgi:hypothetical protein
MRIIRTHTTSTEEKACNYANNFKWCILISDILKFCFVSSESSLFFQRLLITSKGYLCVQGYLRIFVNSRGRENIDNGSSPFPSQFPVCFLFSLQSIPKFAKGTDKHKFACPGITEGINLFD